MMLPVSLLGLLGLLGGLMSRSGDDSESSTEAITLPDPEPTPEPTPEPAPAPEPIPEPEPVTEPTGDSPADPAPVTPDPVTPDPVSPAPVTPDPVAPAPVVAPAPAPTPTPAPEPSPEPVAPQPVAGAVAFFLVNTRTDEVLEELTDGMALSGAMIGDPNLSLIAVPAEDTDAGSVLFNYQNGAETRTENFEPYALFGNGPGDNYYAPKGTTLFSGEGAHSLEVEVFSGMDGTGTLLARETLTVTLGPAEPGTDSADDTSDTPVTDVPDNDADDRPVTAPSDTPAPDGNVDDIDAPDQPGADGSGADTDPVAIEGRVDVMTGRVTTLEAPQGEIARIEILEDVSHGHVTVNDDNSFALVLTETQFTGNQDFTYKVTYADGSSATEQVNLKLTPGAQESGWATGTNHYMLATDENDKVIVEAGEDHVKVFVSGSSDALTLADIARAEGMKVSDVDGKFLAQHGGYGHSEATALAEDAAIALWGELNPRHSVSSNHLLFERGYEYTEFGGPETLERYVSGESELNPILIGAYGEGDKPFLENGFYQPHGGENVVVQDIHFEGFRWQGSGANVLLDNISVTQHELVLQRIEGATVRNSDITDVHREVSRDGGDWEASQDRVSGMFGNFNNGLLLEGNLFDLNGWELGYDPGHSGAAGQPPSFYNHNVYLGADNEDVTVRDNISARGASMGFQIRTGGLIEDNVSIDDNIGITNMGGDYKGRGPEDNYSLISDNLITSAGHKISDKLGGMPQGLRDFAQLSSLVDNIVAHQSNPDDPQEFADKFNSQPGVISDNPYYDDTIVWNWIGSKPTRIWSEKNAEGLDEDVLNDTTIQNFAAQLLGKSDATIADLMDFLRAQEAADGEITVDNHTILKYFQEGFGLDDEARTEAATLRFEPDDLGDGIRWDNRLNWNTDDLPGEASAQDNVDLGGNHVVFGTNSRINELEIGEDGELTLYGGRLTADGGIEGDGDLLITGAGQGWFDGGDGADLDILVEGGRFANTGEMSGASLTATGGQAILATGGGEFDLDAGDRLEIHGDARVGFDGEDGDLALLDLHEGARVIFGNDDGHLGEIGEFRSGAFGDAPDVASGIDLGNASLEIELAGVSAAQSGSTLQLMSADELVGIFEEAQITGLGARNAEIVVDYEADTVKLVLTNGAGNISISTVGEESDISSDSAALWEALTAGQGVANDRDEAALNEDDEDLAADAA